MRPPALADSVPPPVVGEAPVKLKNGREAHVTLHIVEGSKDDIEKQLRQSIDAFFDLYPEI